MRRSIFLISLTAPRAAAFQSPQAPRPRTRRHSTPPDDGTFGSDGPMMAADPDAEFAALEAMAQANAAPAAAPAAPAAAAAAPEPQSYAEAEALALELCAVAAAAGGVVGSPGDEGEARRLYGEAVALFEQALKLPGDDYDVRRVSAQNSPVGGAPVLRDLERVSFPSVLQRQTAHYNIACCRAKLGDATAALDALETALSLGFDDFQLVQREGDFATMRGDVDRLVQRFRPKGLFKDVSFPEPRGAPGGLEQAETPSLFGVELPVPKLPNPFGGEKKEKSAPSLPSLPNPFGGLMDGIKKGIDQLDDIVDLKDDGQKKRRR